MTNDLGAMQPTFKNGQEKFHSRFNPDLEIRLQDFWSWSVSDLVSNATRGILAEFIVGQALKVRHLKTRPRDEWQAYDLETTDGLKVEVKSAAYLQSWGQKKFSSIQFSIARTLAWDQETNQQGTVKDRHADVYVFALLTCQDKSCIDPLDLDQWEFYVLSRKRVDGYERSQHSITLNSLKGLTSAVAYSELREAVIKAVEENQVITPSAHL